MFNIVEMVADHEDCAFDQPCKYGHRVEGHAVYCHNDEWKEGPRKCRRTWHTGGEVMDEDCEGFAANPDYKQPNVQAHRPAVAGPVQRGVRACNDKRKD